MHDGSNLLYAVPGVRVGRASGRSLGPYILSVSHSLYPFTAIHHLYRTVPVPVPAHAYIRQLTDRQLPIPQQQRHTSLRQDQNLSNECIAGNISVEAKKPTIIVNSTTTITTRLPLHILFPAMSPAAEEELTCRKPLKPTGISMLRTTFYRATRCMCPKMEASRTSLRASTTNTGSCKQLSRSFVASEGRGGFHHFQAVRRHTLRGPNPLILSQISTSCRPPFELLALTLGPFFHLAPNAFLFVLPSPFI